MLPKSAELEQAFLDAARRASARGQSAGSIDLIGVILEQDRPRRVAGGLALSPALAIASEPPSSLERLLEAASRLATRYGSRAIEPLHVLAVICRTTESAAYGALSLRGCDPTRLRAAALRELMSPPLPRRPRPKRDDPANPESAERRS